MNGVMDDTYAQTVAVLPAYARGMAGRLAALWAPSGTCMGPSIHHCPAYHCDREQALSS